MRFFDLDIQQLGERDLAAWRRFAAPGGRLISPYLTPDFAKVIASARDDVRVAVAEDADGPAAFFAYHAGSIARPVGAPMSDYQGVVCREGTQLSVSDLLNTTQAGAMVYENWATTPAPGRVRSLAGSCVLDLSEGSQAFFTRRRSLYRNHFRKMDQRARKAEREFGAMRVEFGDPVGARFETLKAWKSAQYRASGLLDLFSIGWVDQALNTFAARRFGPFRGLTCALYFGDRLAAVEFGLVAGGAYHSWFPAYDRQFASASPGLQLIHAIAEAAPRLGIDRIDLGKSEADYKKYYADYEVPLFQGRVVTGSLAGARIAGWELAETVTRHLPGPASKIPARLRRRWAQTSAFEPRRARRLALMGAAVGAQFGLLRD